MIPPEVEATFWLSSPYLENYQPNLQISLEVVFLISSKISWSVSQQSLANETLTRSSLYLHNVWQLDKKQSRSS